MDKIAVIGAGKTGRGFIARLIAENNIEIMFVDKNRDLVNKLNYQKNYSIHFFGNVRQPFKINNYKAYTWEGADFSDISLIFISVGGSNLADVAKDLRGRLEKGIYNVITCENANNPAKTMEKNYGAGINVGFSEATVFCTTIEKDRLDILSENYPYLQCDKKPLKSNMPEVSGIVPVDGFENFLLRKLFTYNAASAIIAYMGWLKGYKLYSDAANDLDILTLLDKNYTETNKALCKIYGYEIKDQEEFAKLSKIKFCNPAILDTVGRNAREPHRKLTPDERVIGPMNLIYQNGGDTGALQIAAAAMLLYADEDEKEWMNIKNNCSYEKILENICKLPIGSELSNGILSYVFELKKTYNKQV